MTIQEIIYDTLTNDSVLSDKIINENGFNLFPLAIPEDKLGVANDRKFIVYSLINNSHVQDIDLNLANYQVTIACDKYNSALDLKDDIIRLLNRFKIKVNNIDIKFTWLIDEIHDKDQKTNMFYIYLIFTVKYLDNNN